MTSTIKSRGKSNVIKIEAKLIRLAKLTDIQIEQFISKPVGGVWLRDLAELVITHRVSIVNGAWMLRKVALA